MAARGHPLHWLARQAIVLAAQHYDGPEPVNIGAGFEITIADLAEKIRDLTGYPGRIAWDTTKPDGQPRRCLETSRAEAFLGFRAEMSFDEGLRQTIEWWEQHEKAA